MAIAAATIHENQTTKARRNGGQQYGGHDPFWINRAKVRAKLGLPLGAQPRSNSSQLTRVRRRIKRNARNSAAHFASSAQPGSFRQSVEAVPAWKIVYQRHPRIAHNIIGQRMATIQSNEFPAIRVTLFAEILRSSPAPMPNKTLRSK